MKTTYENYNYIEEYIYNIDKLKSSDSNINDIYKKAFNMLSPSASLEIDYIDKLITLYSETKIDPKDNEKFNLIIMYFSLRIGNFESIYRIVKNIITNLKIDKKNIKNIKKTISDDVFESLIKFLNLFSLSCILIYRNDSNSNNKYLKEALLNYELIEDLIRNKPNPDLFSVNINKAYILLINKKSDDAIKLLIKTYKKFPEYGITYYNLGNIYEKIDKKIAKGYYTNALKAKIPFELAETALRNLENADTSHSDSNNLTALAA